MENIKALPGFEDVLPDESYKWRYVESVLHECARQFAFNEIRFPILERTELFVRGVGETTDVVQKEMYTFDAGGEEKYSLTMRPEGTASAVRSFIENHLDSGGLPVKCYYIAPNFRHEKPQKGRLRQHHQFGVEYFGAASYFADAEVISVAATYINRLGINNVSLHINSIGCPDCRKEYYAVLTEYFSKQTDSLCSTCKDRLTRNPMRILDCKSPVCSNIAKDAPKTVDYICKECKSHFDNLQTMLNDMNIAHTVDTSIVRGLDYYRGTVFEFIAENIGAQATICAGGRYDSLVEQLGGKPMPGLGFGSGLERLMLAMEASGVNIPKPGGVDIFIASIGEKAHKFAALTALNLRRAGIAAEYDPLARSVKAQMRFADKINAHYTAVIGDNELETNTVNLKNMQTGKVETTKINRLPRELGADEKTSTILRRMRRNEGE